MKNTELKPGTGRVFKNLDDEIERKRKSGWEPDFRNPKYAKKAFDATFFDLKEK